MPEEKYREIIDKAIRNVPDFPKPGIQFKDITPVLQNPQLLRTMVEWFVSTIDKNVTGIAGIESRGFILGTVVAHELNLGFTPIRKKGKLPYKTYREDYALEYGTDSLEIHQDAYKAGDKVAIIDDLLATGGTADASIRLVQKSGAEVVSVHFLIELDFLQGRKKLEKHSHTKAFSLIHY